MPAGAPNIRSPTFCQRGTQQSHTHPRSATGDLTAYSEPSALLAELVASRYKWCQKVQRIKKLSQAPALDMSRTKPFISERGSGNADACMRVQVLHVAFKTSS